MFKKYKAGVIDRKSKGYEGLIDEAEDVYLRMVNFTQQALDEPDWGRREHELEIINALDF